MTRRTLTLLLILPALGWSAWAAGADDKTHKLTTISPRKLADSLHTVIAADREAYIVNVVQPARSGQPTAPGCPSLPVHAQLLRSAAQSIQKQGAEFSYTLRSLAPINENNGPQTEAEQVGLEFVAKHPGEAYYAEEELGGRSYFTGIYADRATVSSCVECHNQHPRSPRHDLKLGDVMGAIVVRVPLEF